MNAKASVPRQLAARDIDEALSYYLEHAGESTALTFIDALEQAFRHIAISPATGSPRYAHELDLPGLRFWPLHHFPYLIFYIENANSIDVWRVLHGQRDIPAQLQ